MIGAVVVTYNSAEVIGACLDACRNRAHQTVVVDNASQDATLDHVRQRPWVRVIANAENRGFAAAANQGVESLESDLVLLLNPDVELLSSLDPLAEACSGKSTAGASGLLVDASGEPQSGFSIRRFPAPATLIFEVLGLNRLFPANPINRRYRCLDLNLKEPQDIEQPPGAFLLFRRETWRELGGFDSAFHPLWFEDVDFCRRLARGGLKIRYVPQVTARHRGGHSIDQLRWSSRELYWYASLLRYAAKDFSTGAFRAVCLAVGLGSILRAAARLALDRSSEVLRVYGKVIHLAADSAIRGRLPDARPLGASAQSSRFRSGFRKIDRESKR